jgi:hypothetical protein
VGRDRAVNEGKKGRKGEGVGSAEEPEEENEEEVEEEAVGIE